MGDLVAHMSPKSQAIVRREVGGFKMRIPVDFGDGTPQYVQLGINLTSAPLDVFENNPVAVFRLRQALQRALTDDILVRDGKGARAAEDVKMADLLADTIMEKVRDTL